VDLRRTSGDDGIRLFFVKCAAPVTVPNGFSSNILSNRDPALVSVANADH
jgi:hypothetical protein